MNLPTTSTNPYEPSNSLDQITFKSLRGRLPISVYVGLLLSIASIGLWTAWCFSEQRVFMFLTIPLRLALLGTPVLFYKDLSKFLYRRTHIAIVLGLTLIATTIFAGAAYLPRRESFLKKFNNDACYSFSTRPGWGSSKFPPHYGKWLNRWNRRIPHVMEVLMTVIVFSGILSVCTVFRLDQIGGLILTISSYVWLFIAPIIAGLIAYDFDIFLKGIVFDSISLDLLPFTAMFPGPQSIFLFVLYLIFFSVSALFMFTAPRSDLSNHDPTTPRG
ncbi:MAG: hypothetical protein JNL58_09625 [Planctomyces sp.]|nr:hypothetical protein [Planctomyces sp.]